MPTGYTAYIEDGDITTGKDFLLLCSRAFGVAIDIRDEPLSVPTPTSFEPKRYYKRRYDDAVKELEKAKSLSLEEAREIMNANHSERVERARRTIKRMAEVNERYANIRRQVEAWIPPTADHRGIKEFALEQIDMCVNGANLFGMYNKMINEPFCDCDSAVREYLSKYIKAAEDEVKRAKKTYEEEIERAKAKSLFMKTFVESLEDAQ